MNVLAQGQFTVIDIAEKAVERMEVLFGKSSSESDVPDSWSPEEPFRYVGEILWTKWIIYYNTGESEETIPYPVTGDKGDNGQDLTKEPSIKVECDHTSYMLSSRGVCKHEQTLSFKAILTEILGTPSWIFYKNGVKAFETTGIDVSFKINVNDNFTNLEAEATLGSYSDKLKIYGQYDGNTEPERVRAGYNNSPIPYESLIAIKTLDDGVSPLLFGDYAYAEIYDENNNLFKTPVVYDGISEWIELSADNKYYAMIMSNILPDALNNAIPSQSIINLYVKNFVALTAVIQELFSKFIELTGAIYGGAYNAKGENPENGPGFHIDAASGIIQAMDATLERATIKGEISGTHFNSIAKSANVTNLSLSSSTNYYYSTKTVDIDFYDFITKNVITSGTMGVVSASGIYQGESFNTISVFAGTIGDRFSVVGSALFFMPNGSASSTYVSFSKVTSITHNGQTFTSDQDKYKLFAMTSDMNNTMSIIKTKYFTIAKGTIQCGSITLSGSEESPIAIKTVNSSSSKTNYVFSKDGQTTTVYSDYNSLPFSINLDLFENLQGIQATNIYRGNVDSSIGTANEPFKNANIENITSTKIIVPNIEAKNGIVNITGSGVLNGLTFNGNVNSADSNYKVYRAVFN